MSSWLMRRGFSPASTASRSSQSAAYQSSVKPCSRAVRPHSSWSALTMPASMVGRSSPFSRGLLSLLRCNTSTHSPTGSYVVRSMMSVSFVGYSSHLMALVLLVGLLLKAPWHAVDELVRVVEVLHLHRLLDNAPGTRTPDVTADLLGLEAMAEVAWL